jgi:NADPH-dependent 2,4-dienoyl-CoA reductase/sulfur reductase-like enzyme/Fe-S-cluster-containing hydrogenase component 2/pSer/pThr/pTyr-binding forkhead associated (FHA) protein/CRP-like cAMP-binding protein
MGKELAYLIVGNGITGVTAAEILRSEDSTSSITIVADDPFPVYYRPALKDYLGGRLNEDKLWARPGTFYREQHIRFVPGRVMGINTVQSFVQLHDGQQIGYHKLLLANGARPRQLSCPGLDLAGVSTLRTVADYQEILRRLDSARRIVVCGSGTLALESAETLNHCGYEVTHLLRQSMLWSEVLDPIASDLVLQEEQRDGIDGRTGEEIAEIVGRRGEVCAVITTSGARIPCDMVLIAIGIEPLTGFIRASGIACGRGVKVDNGMRTNVPNIYAAGDVIETTDAMTGRTRVIGQWYPSIQQARTAAYSMLDVQAATHADNDYYNATFLYGLDFVSIGLTTKLPRGQHFQQIAAEPQPRSYRKVILQQGVAVGALFLGDRKNALAFKRAIDHRVNLAPVAGRLFAENFHLDDWLDGQGVPQVILNVGRVDGQAREVTGRPDQFTGRPTHAGRPQGSPLPWTVAAPQGESGMAYLVPVPHARVRVDVRETRIGAGSAGEVFTIGRQRGVSLLIEHGSVSRVHAEIGCSNGEYVLRDRGSTNGTFVNNVALAMDRAYTLHNLDVVRFGDAQFRFEARNQVAGNSDIPRGASMAFQHVEGTQLHANVSRIIPESVLASLTEAPSLVLVRQGDSARVVPVEFERRYTLGRGRENDITLDDMASSRRHAEIFSAPDGFYVRDLESRNGVIVNRGKINNAYHLSHGDRMVIGDTLVYFSYPRPVMTAGTMNQDPTAKTSAVRRAGAEGAKELQFAAQAGGHEGRPYNTPTVVGMEHRGDVQALTGERIHFEIDMCIGCDRCMDACPVPMSSLVNIADLNHATVSDDVTAHVARFTHECIMCGSCVPVCPVDNHRDLLMLSLKQRVGVSWDNQVDMSRIAESLPAGWTLGQLTSRLREHRILSDAQLVPENYMLHVVAASRLRILMPGDAAIREGEYGRELHLILEGRLAVYASEAGDSRFPIAILRRGEHVGEDGMLTGQPYKVTAQAQVPTLVLQVPEQAMQLLMELVPNVRAYFDQVNNARSMKSILKRMALFQGVSDADLQALIKQTPVKQYERNERLFAEDDQGGRPARETLHILLEGFVKVARHTTVGTGHHKSDERIIAYRQGGDYFAGGLDLLGDGRAVSVSAINRVRVAEVPRKVMLALLQRYPEVNQRFNLRLREYIETSVSTQGYALTTGLLKGFSAMSTRPDEAVQAGLHALVSDGVVEGTEVLVIDLDKCIHCSECEEACARRHGHSRMNRKGMIVGNISIATACRQCQDPVCMLCSRAGIARHPNGEVYITESCIGCGICAERCPYGAISIMNIEDETVSHSSWQRFSDFFTKGAGTGKERARKNLPVLGGATAMSNYAAPGPLDTLEHRDGYDELRKKIAIKCDLCAGYKDQACVEACPTGAAIRIQPTKFFGSTEEILRRRVM